jgi:hypothetical protein
VEGLLEVLRSKITYEIKDRIKIDSVFLFVRMGKWNVPDDIVRLNPKTES